MGKKGVQKTRPPACRSDKGKLDRAMAQRYLRATGSSLPAEHRWMFAFAAENQPDAVSLDDIYGCSHRLSEQGMAGTSARVLSLGSSPDTRRVIIDGAPPQGLSKASSEDLYSKLCDLESLRAEAEAQAADIFSVLLQRGYFVEGESHSDSTTDFAVASGQ